MDTFPLDSTAWHQIAARLHDAGKDYAASHEPHMAIVATAALMAQELHAGQVDKAGCDYFSGHLCAVALSGTTWQEMAVGFLHDAAEDTPHTTQEIFNRLKHEVMLCHEQHPQRTYCPTIAEWQEVGDALLCLNSLTATSREAYIARFAGHRLACAVKINDLKHNMDISRIPHPTAHNLARLARYQAEHTAISTYLTRCTE